MKISDSVNMDTEKFQEFARVGIERWLEVIKDWLKYSNNIYVIYYEVKELTSVLPFLMIPLVQSLY